MWIFNLSKAVQTFFELDRDIIMFQKQKRNYTGKWYYWYCYFC